MQNYSREFLRALERVETLRERLRGAQRELQAVCPHVHLDGSSAFPRGLSFTECTLCDLSNHDLGLEAFAGSPRRTR